jgi:hypothetical protein
MAATRCSDRMDGSNGSCSATEGNPEMTMSAQEATFAVTGCMYALMETANLDPQIVVVDGMETTAMTVKLFGSRYRLTVEPAVSDEVEPDRDHTFAPG